MDEWRAPRALRILYVVLVAAVVIGGVWTISDWAHRGGELPGGAIPVTGRVVEEHPGFTGALAIVEVTYEAGGRERRARLPVAGSDNDPTIRTFEPGDPIALLVSKSNPDRVQQQGWATDHAPTTKIPGWLLVVGAVAIITPLVLPGPRRRIEAALQGSRKIGGGRGI